MGGTCFGLLIVLVLLLLFRSEDERALEESLQRVGEDWDGSMVYNHPDNPFLEKIPDDYEIHEYSEEMITFLKEQMDPNRSNVRLSVGEYAIPVFLATNSTPTRNIEFYLYGAPPSKTHMTSVPFLIGSNPAMGSDHHYTIIQQDTKCVYEFWLFDYNKAGSGNAISMDSNGIYEDGRSSVTAGWSNLQGIIWPKELKESNIEHALSFSVPITSAQGYVTPATKTDGVVFNNDFAIPEGTLIRIRPDFDIDAMTEIGPIEKTVYKAIQTYDMYCGDTNGSGIAIRAVSPSSVNSESYPDSFDTNNPLHLYYLKNLLFEALEVVQGGPLQSIEQREYIDHGCATWE